MSIGARLGLGFLVFLERFERGSYGALHIEDRHVYRDLLLLSMINVKDK